MPYDPYSRLNQQTLDAVVVGGAFYFACLIGYGGRVPLGGDKVMAAGMALVVGRLIANYLFGLHHLQWRYIGLRDLFRVSQSYVAFSCLLVVFQVVFPVYAMVRIPVNVIAAELLLSLFAAMGVRVLRRSIYETQSRRLDSPKKGEGRRLLLIGAGMIGANVAREMAAGSAVHIVGFLDDDPRKLGAVIGGVIVLGPTALLPEIVRTQKVDSVLICISPAARGSVDRLVALLDTLPVTSKFLPSITEILSAKDDLPLGRNGLKSNGHGAQCVVPLGVVESRAEIRNKTILITGGAGFIGSALGERLVADNEIILFDRFFSDQPVTFTSLYGDPRVRKIEGDILDGKALADLAHNADIVVHAAAMVGVGRVCNYPRETLETNFVGTLQILKAVEKSRRLERFIYFSTSEVFGVNSFRANEDTPMAIGPAAEARWSYAIAKLAGEHLVNAYHRQANLPVVTVRPFNVFGPRRLGSHAILSFILNSLQGNAIEVHGDGSQIRSWCYITDFCDALIEMMARPAAVGEDFNIGNPNNTVTIYDLARMVLEATGQTVPVVLTDSPCPDIGIRVPSLQKARQILNYQPVCDLRRGLKLTADWYRQNLGFFEMRQASGPNAVTGNIGNAAINASSQFRSPDLLIARSPDPR
ncbi:MAG TPA: NAD-dependent epimerase/dehydratase family protein [Candidatus Saccharimonadales bacterium]|jgi:UDP-glucose 4-epimerase|nr:NAD-dependent epimerase/dehydratase family protein [Candidatus Saccharimonadales bacterium]